MSNTGYGSIVIRGNLGWSHSVAMLVFEAIFYFLPATVELALFATPLIVLEGIILGSLAATHKRIGLWTILPGLLLLQVGLYPPSGLA